MDDVDWPWFEGLINTYEGSIRYLAIDPGEDNGVCAYDENYGIRLMKTIHHEDMTRVLNLFKHLDLIVLEDYRVFPHKALAHVRNKLTTLRVIGRVEAVAELNEAKIIQQPSSIKPNAYMWMGKKPLPKSDPMNHALDAHAHFVYWGVRTGRMNPKDLL